MTIEEAIYKAIKGGWRKEEKPDLEVNNDGCVIQFYGGENTEIWFESDIFLDPKFWQALGKAMGWSKCVRCGSLREEHGGGNMWWCPAPKHTEGMSTTADLKTFRSNNWNNRWHKFIDHLAEDKTADSYFKSLN